MRDLGVWGSEGTMRQRVRNDPHTGTNRGSFVAHYGTGVLTSAHAYLNASAFPTFSGSTLGMQLCTIWLCGGRPPTLSLYVCSMSAADAGARTRSCAVVNRKRVAGAHAARDCQRTRRRVSVRACTVLQRVAINTYANHSSGALKPYIREQNRGF